MMYRRPKPKFDVFPGHPMNLATLERDIVDRKYDEAIRAIYRDDGYEELYDRAKYLQNQALQKTDKAPVVIVPGTMSTQLTKSNGDVVWIDPLNLLFHWESLALSETKPNLRPGGLLLGMGMYYLRLILSLKCEGHPVDYFPYDWRLGFNERADLLRRHLEINRLTDAGKIHFVTHSEGGMVVRGLMSNMARPYDFIDKLILLGAPNYGAWPMIQMFQGQYAKVFRHYLPEHYHEMILDAVEHQRLNRTPEYIAKLLTSDTHSVPVLLLEGWRQAADRAVDLLNGPLFKPLMFADRYLVKALETYLTKTLVFTWPAYYDMLPFPERWPALAPLFETTNWPQNFPRPHQKLLDQARLTQKQLCQSASPPAAGQEGHQAWHLLIGTGIETLTEVTLSEHQFHYRSSFDGDGMIAVESSAMEDAYFSKRFPGVCHTELMSDAAVVQTITDILAQRPL